jgi:hypothetical protein
MSCGSTLSKRTAIAPFLGGHRFDPETKRVMGVAFEMTRAALRLADRDDPATEMVAKKIIELANARERDADRLCELALKDFRGGHERDAAKARRDVLPDAHTP